MNELIAKIEQWAEDRNIIKGSKPIDQAMKLFSEFGELADNVGKGRDCRDDVGDVFVVLTIIAKQVEVHSGKKLDIAHAVKRLEKCPYIKTEYNPKSDVVGICNRIHLFAKHFNKPKLNDIIVSIDFLLSTLGYTLEECVQIAYNDIKDRKGVVYNGVFIKESDPAYQDALDNIEADKRMASQKRISVNIEDL